ncbi:hypothetical protein COB21_00265 [Candidatus Aerophobetes bacterium]|uniref:Uncharacterized protein n=1 Tax=Aerophobetes bacterium TaxID=2030807 RepID=A0A2A4X945_UNCAE|nr:MAG: hypothetical protein COB21_00265 [Candidatus Aerophobetes bacterium]
MSVDTTRAQAANNQAYASEEKGGRLSPTEAKVSEVAQQKDVMAIMRANKLSTDSTYTYPDAIEDIGDEMAAFSRELKNNPLEEQLKGASSFTPAKKAERLVKLETQIEQLNTLLEQFPESSSGREALNEHIAIFKQEFEALNTQPTQTQIIEDCQDLKSQLTQRKQELQNVLQDWLSTPDKHTTEDKVNRCLQINQSLLHSK